MTLSSASWLESHLYNMCCYYPTLREDTYNIWLYYMLKLKVNSQQLYKHMLNGMTVVGQQQLRIPQSVIRMKWMRWKSCGWSTETTVWLSSILLLTHNLHCCDENSFACRVNQFHLFLSILMNEITVTLTQDSHVTELQSCYVSGYNYSQHLICLCLHIAEVCEDRVLLLCAIVWQSVIDTDSYAAFYGLGELKKTVAAEGLIADRTSWTTTLSSAF